MINYSLMARLNPQDRDADPKFYATPQVTEKLTLGEFSKHIASHGSVYSRADIQAVIIQMVDCLREMLLEGKKVSLGDLGEFTIGFNSKGVDNPQFFDPTEQVKDVHVNWCPGSDFVDLKEHCTFNNVPNRRIQRLMLKAIKAGDTTVDISDPNAEEDDV